MLLQSLQERTGSLRGLNGVVGGGVEGVKLELQLSGQKWDTLLSLTPISSPPHFNSVAHTRKAAAKIKTSSSDSLSTLRQLFVLFFFLFFCIWFHQVWLTSMHTSAFDHASASTAGLTGQDRAEHRSCRAPEQKHSKHISEPSNEPMQRPAVHKCSRKHTHLHTHTLKENHNPKIKS